MEPAGVEPATSTLRILLPAQHIPAKVQSEQHFTAGRPDLQYLARSSHNPFPDDPVARKSATVQRGKR